MNSASRANHLQRRQECHVYNIDTIIVWQICLFSDQMTDFDNNEDCASS